MKLACLLCCLSLLTACRSAPAIHPSAEARALLETDRAFAALSAQSGPKVAFAAYMAPDGIMLPRTSEGALEGYDRVIAAFGEGDQPGYRLLWQPQFAEVAASGELGWSWGQYQVLIDGQQAVTGKYVNIWKKQADGSWKVRLDMGNQRPGKE